MIKHPNYNQGNIYLSGGMEYADDMGGDWRENLSHKLKALNFFPLDITALDREYAKRHGDLFYNADDGTELGFLRKKATIRKHFIYTDLQLIINDTDAVVLYFDESARRGAGTISEAQIAYLHDIPIFIVSAWDDWKTEIPGWLAALSTKIFNNFTNLITYMGHLPKGILKRDLYGNHNSGDQYLCSLSGIPFKKSNDHFVSKISPLYSKDSVKIVRETHEKMKDRYEFFIEYIEQQAKEELKCHTSQTKNEPN